LKKISNQISSHFECKVEQALQWLGQKRKNAIRFASRAFSGFIYLRGENLLARSFYQKNLKPTFNFGVDPNFFVKYFVACPVVK
jgi:hypothetical protein